MKQWNDGAERAGTGAAGSQQYGASSSSLGVWKTTIFVTWAAATAWLMVLLGFHVLITGQVPSWLNTTNSSVTWITWFAAGTLPWVGAHLFASLRQVAKGSEVLKGSVAAGLLLGSSWTTQRSAAGRQCSSRHLGCSSTTQHSSSCSSSDDEDGTDSSKGNASRRSLDRQLRKQLGLPSSSAARINRAESSRAGGAKELDASHGPLSMLAGLRPTHAAAASGPAAASQRSCLAKLQRRLSAVTSTKAYSEVAAHAGQVLVLYVDSSPIDQAVLAMLLGNEPGFKLISVSSGVEALSVAFGSRFLPDVVLMDVLLPDMKASEVCSQLRSVFSPAELPIVLLSSRSGEADMLAALEGGVNDFLFKPLRRLELLARINSQMLIKQSVRREAESRSHYELLVQVLPPHIIQRLAAGQSYIPEQHAEVTVLFSDIVGFTELCALWPTQDVVAMLDMMFSSFDELCDRHGVFKVETIGDAYMIVAGHDGSTDHTLRMAAMAVDMLAAAEDIQYQLMSRGLDGKRVQIRIGMHTGPALSGVVGKRRPRYCFFGDTVNTGSRMESSGFPMTVHISDACARSMVAAAAAAAQQTAADEGVADHSGCISQGGSAAADAGSTAEQQQLLLQLPHGQLPWELLDLGVQHVKGKGRMRTHLLQVGEWQAALTSLHIKQLQQAIAVYDHSSTCSTSPASFSNYLEQDTCSTVFDALGLPSGVDASSQLVAASSFELAPQHAEPLCAAKLQLKDDLVPRRVSSAFLGHQGAASWAREASQGFAPCSPTAQGPGAAGQKLEHGGGMDGVWT